MTDTRDLIVDSIAAYRITRLLTADKVTLPYRARVIAWAYDQKFDQLDERSLRRADGQPHRMHDEDWDELATHDIYAPKLVTLVRCRYCVGFYCAVGVIAARHLAPSLWDRAAKALVVASAAALLAGLEKP